MQDVNDSRFALLLGIGDWGACALVPEDADPSASPPTPLKTLWDDDDRARRSATPLEFDARANVLSLTRRVARFHAGASDTLPDMQRRLGAAADGHRNVYWVTDGGRRVDVLSSGSRTVSVMWSMQASAPKVTWRRPANSHRASFRQPPCHACCAALRSRANTTWWPACCRRTLSRAACWCSNLLAGGPPLSVAWPSDWPFVPHDVAARPCGGLAVLDRVHRRVWMLDRRLGMHAVFPVDTSDEGLPGDFAPPDASPQTAPAARRPWFNTVLDGAGGADPVALDVLADDAVLVMDGVGSDGFALLSIYQHGTLTGRASTGVARDVIDADDVLGFVFRGFDCALQTAVADAPPRLVVVSHEGNQCIAFDLSRSAAGLKLDPVESFLPLRRFGGLGLVPMGSARVTGDTGLLYDSLATWVPLVAQRRPRFAPRARLQTPVFDGREPNCVWHRLVIDGCISAVVRCSWKRARPSRKTSSPG